MKYSKVWFTLVELIVVTTILAVLWSIGFISYANYISGTRDTKRLWDLVAIKDGLTTLLTRWDAPLPDAYTTIQAWTGNILIWYQWFLSNQILTSIWMDNGWMDPKDGYHYTYYLLKDRRNFQLMAWFENQPDKLWSTAYLPLVDQAYARTPDYQNRVPKTYGKALGIITDTLNFPIQERIPNGVVNITTTGATLRSYLTDTNVVTWTGGALLSTLPNGNCKRILDNGNSYGDGVYRIDPSGDGGFDVWCDMTTDGWGWTIATMLADSTTQNLFQTANTNKIVSLKDNIATAGQIGDIWRDSADKDLMFVCFTSNAAISPVTFPFIVYKYRKSDIARLTIQNKASTAFSTTNLKAKYRNFNYTLSTNWGWSTTQHVLNDTTSPWGVWLLDAGANPINLFNDAWRKPNSWTWNASWFLSSPLNTSNYCISAIR